MFETDFKRTWVDLSALYLKFDYKEFEKQSLVCLSEFPMIWKWLGLFQNLKNIYSKEFQNMVEIFSWVLNIKHILKAISKGVEKENLFGFDWKSSFWKVKHFKMHKKWTIEFKVLIQAKQYLLEA